MKEQFDNQALVSIYRWFDHVLLQEGEAFENISSQLYPQEDGRIGGLYKYASPNKQWVYDSSVSGAQIPDGITVSGSPVPFSSSLFPDWDNGRILSTNDLGSDIQADYSTKNINLYITNDPEEQIIFQNNYSVNDFYTLPESGIEPYKNALPACFLTFSNTSATPYAMGNSEYQSEDLNVRAIVITNNSMHLDGCFSIFRRQNNKNFPILSFEDDPFNGYGSLKSGPNSEYRYTNFLADDSRDLIHISEVKTSKFFAGSHEALPQAMKVGFINFKLNYLRTP